MQTKVNSLNIDWAEYDFNGACPDCDLCRNCGHAHDVGSYHRCNSSDTLPLVKLEWDELGFMKTSPDWKVQEYEGPSILLGDYVKWVEDKIFVGLGVSKELVGKDSSNKSQK